MVARGAGDLDRLILIRRATVAPNALNEQIETWSDLAQVRAKKEDVSAAERLRAQEVGATITARFTIRWSSQVADVNAKDRIYFDELRLEYDIVAVRDSGGRRKWRELDAVARPDR